MGVVFLVCVPTASYEHSLRTGIKLIQTGQNEFLPQQSNVQTPPSKLNIVPETKVNAIMRLEVELRDKNQPAKKKNKLKPIPVPSDVNIENIQKVDVPMEKILDELLKKLEIEHVVWYSDKLGNYHQVIFPTASGDPCETTIHCLTELGIGKKFNSSLSVLPCSVSFDATNDTSNEDENGDDEDNSKWNNFVESIKSKLTVKQVVDGVRSGGSLTFDYLLLIVTADSLAALGLIENNASNIVAAMLVSPLMGPVMSITFGAIISDRELIKVGFISLALGIFISILFGFIFGLILGTTTQPWGSGGDFPTEEMKGRGNYRSLWMGVMWALTSGSGVAVALLQGSAGPLIGVAISASLLPPVVNCGLFWALACIWLIYDDIKFPYIKGDPLHKEGPWNSSYVPVYTNYIPTEFFINGIVSALLTVVNVICIFITAIIVLKIKEVAAPYTSTPDLRRFWETDIRTVRRTNRSTIRRRNTAKNDSQSYENLKFNPKAKDLENSLEQALREAADDTTFKKIKRISYSANAAELSDKLPSLSTSGGTGNSNGISKRNSRNAADLELLDKLVNSLLEAKQTGSSSPSESRSSTLRRLNPLTRSLRLGSFRRNSPSSSTTATMPTIMESGTSGGSGRNRSSWSSSDRTKLPGVKRVLETIANAPQRFSSSTDRAETQNILN